MLLKLMKEEGYDIEQKHDDCGKMLYDKKQKTMMGASGTGCSACVFNSIILNRLNKGFYKKILFVATGALLSTTSQQQGDSIPCIAHAVVIESQAKGQKPKNQNNNNQTQKSKNQRQTTKGQKTKNQNKTTKKEK